MCVCVLLPWGGGVHEVAFVHIQRVAPLSRAAPRGGPRVWGCMCVRVCVHVGTRVRVVVVVCVCVSVDVRVCVWC